MTDNQEDLRPFALLRQAPTLDQLRQALKAQRTLRSSIAHALRKKGDSK
jgi:hypothetical protein